MPPAQSLDSVLDAEDEPGDAWSPRVPLLKAVTAQSVASVLILSLALLAPQALRHEAAMAWALAQGVVAALLGRFLRMESWWLPIHVMFVPGLAWGVGLGLSPLYALAAFLLMASFYWGVTKTRVPLFLSSRGAVRALATQVPGQGRFNFADLGCGLGGVLGQLARTHPSGRYVGVEAAPAPFLWSWLRSLASGGRIRIRWADLQTLDLGRYDVVYAYLSPAAMPGLWDKAMLEMRPGSLLVSNCFSIPGAPSPTSTVATGDRNGSLLLIWRL